MNAIKIGRNDPCSCGSGQKYKRCCAGKDAAARSAELTAQASARAAAFAAEAEAQKSEEGETKTPAGKAAARPKRPPLPTTYGANRPRGV